MRKNRKPIALVLAGNPATVSPPINLLCLSTVLKLEGHKTEVYDFTVRPEKEGEFLHRAAKGAFSWVGFTGFAVMMPGVRRLVLKLRALAPALPLLLGGMHASAVPEKTLRYMPLDAVCVGPGEEPVKAFARMVEDGQRNYWEIPGLAALGPRGEYRTTPRPGNPWSPILRPDWEAVRIRDYQARLAGGIRRRPVVAPLITTMGCPNACSFCSANSVFGRRLVHRDPVEVVDEIEYLVKERGVGEIQILDDNFNADLGYAKSVLREWARRDLRTVFRTPSGIWVHSYDSEWFDLLKATNCYIVAFGLETFSKDILSNVGKHINIDAVPDIINMYESRKILTHGYFIVGLPGENYKTISNTIKYACKTNLSHIHTSILIPYPGSKIYNDAVKEGRLLDDWDKLYLYNGSVSSFCELTPEQLKKEMLNFYIKFYTSRPKRVIALSYELKNAGLMPFLGMAKRVSIS